MRVLLAWVSVVMFASSSLAQTIVEPGRSIARTVATGTNAYGLDVDPSDGTVFFIGDNGRDLYRLDTDDSVTQIANNVGIFIGQLSDLVLGPDDLLYAMTTSGAAAGTIQRFMRDGTELAPLATITTTPMSNASGLDFDCRGNLYASDEEVFIFQITPTGDVSNHSVGWQDVDEITAGFDDILYVQDGSARPFGHDKVFRVGPAGTISVFAQGIPGTSYSGAFDWATGDYFVANYGGGEIYRLHDADGDGVADARTTVATGFGSNVMVDIDYGRSSSGDPTEYSLYVSLFSMQSVVEIGGFPAPPSPFDCGPHIDDDGDGWCEVGQDLNGDLDCHDLFEELPMGEVDCDDRLAGVNPSQVEVSPALCSDGFDTDCDGDIDLADDDCEPFDDDDGDGFCEGGRDGNGDGDCLDVGEDIGPFDCDDTRGNVSPGVTENTAGLCTDSLDNDCDGDVDLADADCGGFSDDDGDGFCENGTDLDGDGDCATPAELAGVADCDDGAAAVFPGNTENCADGLDNDCDGDIDIADTECADRRDDDGDGFCELGIDANADGDCTDAGENTIDADCDDTNPSINPAATEDCGDGLDNDCNGLIDGEELACVPVSDRDGDGFCPMGLDLNLDGDCADAGEATADSDCDDAEPTVFPGAPENTVELCRDVTDNDCDTDLDLLDADCAAFVDADADGWCPAGRDLGGDANCIGVGETDGPGPFDCDDVLMSVNPGASEVCDNGIDDDCDTLTDAEDSDCGAFVDADGDGWCPQGQDLNADGDCIDAGEADGAGPFDCNDVDVAVNPDADELCSDGADNDCNGLIDLADDACSAFSDGDGDGVCLMGRDMNMDRDCLDPGEDTGEVDCDDDNDAVAPGLDEVCGDGLDNDCNGLIDAEDGGCSASVDADGDGWCPSGMDMNADGDCLDIGEDVLRGDCNDADAAVNPAAEEICDDSIDNDCDSFIDAEDESCSPDRQDMDGDGWCPMGQDVNGDGDCNDDVEDTVLSDCDDMDPLVNPDALEQCEGGGGGCDVCSDLRDNDCDMLMDDADPGCGGDATVDADGDRICAMAGRDRNGDGDCDDEEEGTGEIDCNDGDNTIFPGADEICDDGIDQNCDGIADELSACPLHPTEGGVTGGSCRGCTVPTGGGNGSAWVLLLLVAPWIRRRMRR